LNLPVNHQNDRVWSASKKRNVDECRLVAERAKFPKHVIVSVGVYFGGKGRLHFIPDNAKVNAELYVKTLLTLDRTCSRLQICFAIWLHLSTGQRACIQGKAGSRLDCYQLQ